MITVQIPQRLLRQHGHYEQCYANELYEMNKFLGENRKSRNAEDHKQPKQS